MARTPGSSSESEIFLPVVLHAPIAPKHAEIVQYRWGNWPTLSTALREALHSIQIVEDSAYKFNYLLSLK
jgi:hypothetical protein